LTSHTSSIKAIQEILVHLEGLIKPIPQHKDFSLNDLLELAMDITKNSIGQYVKLMTDIS
jgi:hypothetical protein